MGTRFAVVAAWLFAASTGCRESGEASGDATAPASSELTMVSDVASAPAWAVPYGQEFWRRAAPKLESVGRREGRAGVVGDQPRRRRRPRVARAGARARRAAAHAHAVVRRDVRRPRAPVRAGTPGNRGRAGSGRAARASDPRCEPRRAAAATVARVGRYRDGGIRMSRCECARRG